MQKREINETGALIESFSIKKEKIFRGKGIIYVPCFV